MYGLLHQGSSPPGHSGKLNDLSHKKTALEPGFTLLLWHPSIEDHRGTQVRDTAGQTNTGVADKASRTRDQVTVPHSEWDLGTWTWQGWYSSSLKRLGRENEPMIDLKVLEGKWAPEQTKRLEFGTSYLLLQILFRLQSQMVTST